MQEEKEKRWKEAVAKKRRETERGKNLREKGDLVLVRLINYA